MLTIHQILTQAQQRLIHTATPRLDAEILLAHVMTCSRSHLIAWPDKQVSSQQSKTFFRLIKQRELGKPVAYILGEKEFWGLTLKVNEHTLVPRSETELLVELALQCFPATEKRRCLDLGTGSGAIALAIASERPTWEILATDKSSQALTIAQQNAAKLGLLNLSFSCGCWYDSLLSHARVDMIVSNPPYIAIDDEHLKSDGVCYEPRSALVADENGLSDIKKIISESRNYLLPDGYLLIEHGYQQAEEIIPLFAQVGYRNIKSARDLQGNARVVMGQLSA